MLGTILNPFDLNEAGGGTSAEQIIQMGCEWLNLLLSCKIVQSQKSQGAKTHLAGEGGGHDE